MKLFATVHDFYFVSQNLQIKIVTQTQKKMAANVTVIALLTKFIVTPTKYFQYGKNKRTMPTTIIKK